MPMELNPAQNPFPFPNHISRKWRKPRVMVLHGNFLATILSGTRESWRKRVPGFWREGLVSASTRSWELSAFFSAVMGPGRCHNWVVEAEVPPWRWCLNLVQILWKFSHSLSFAFQFIIGTQKCRWNMGTSSWHVKHPEFWGKFPKKIAFPEMTTFKNIYILFENKILISIKES